MESSIGQSVHRGLERETWEPGRFGCQTSDEVLWKLDALQTFITDLNWPEKVFATHLQHRLKARDRKYSGISSDNLLLSRQTKVKCIHSVSIACISDGHGYDQFYDSTSSIQT